MKLFAVNVCIALCLLVAAQTPANAALYTLVNGNSVATVNADQTNPGAGMNSWEVDGVDFLVQQWFWYRVGSTGAEAPIDALPLLSSSLVNGVGSSALNLTFGSLTNFTISITYTLTGGQAGSGHSDIAEQININNFTSGNLDMHFFQYSDFDMSGVGNSNNDTLDVSLTSAWSRKSGTGPGTLNPNSGGAIATQTGLNGTVNEFIDATSNTSANPVPTHASASTFPNAVNSLNDGSPTTLPSSPQSCITGSTNPQNCVGTQTYSASGDVAWAFQWDRVLTPTGTPGSTMGISKDKLLDFTAVPEPATLVLLGGCLLVVGRKLSKRVSA